MAPTSTMDNTSPSPNLLRTPKSSKRSSGRRTRRLFPHLMDDVEDSPQGKISVRAASNSPKTKKQLPSKFRQEMPRRSAEFDEENDSPNKVAPITTSSFYGGKSSSYVPKFLSSSFTEKMSLKTPPQKEKTAKKTAKSKSTSRPKVIKFGQQAGLNKGVSHAIKKPKIKKPEKEKPSKSGTESADSDLEEITKKTVPSKNTKTPKMTTLIRKVYTTPETGNISLNNDKSVAFEIKNGQMAFRYRRSPRKSPYFNKTRTPNADPKTPKRLFTPTANQNFLSDFQVTPPKSGRRGRQNLPSPVKFHKEDDKDLDNRSDDEDDQVSNIIQNLDMSQEDNCAVTISDAELERVAAETTTMVFQKQQLDLEISSLLASVQTPTKEEKLENRSNVLTENNLQLALEDEDSNDATEVQTPKKNFAIFDKENRSKPTLDLGEFGSSSKENKIRNGGSKKCVGDDQMIIDAGQKLTDLKNCLECGFHYNPGNKKDEEEHKKNHSIAQKGIHFSGWKTENIVGNEFTAENSRIIVVQSNDQSSHWAKVKDVLQVVDKQLGICSGDNTSEALRKESESKAYLYISSKQIVGFLLAEPIDEKDNIAKAIPDEVNKGHWVLKDLPEESIKVSVGVSRIWTATDFRRKQVATRLVQAMEHNFHSHSHVYPLEKGKEYAFSHTTPDGSKFASKHTGGFFLTYNPSIRRN